MNEVIGDIRNCFEFGRSEKSKFQDLFDSMIPGQRQIGRTGVSASRVEIHRQSASDVHIGPAVFSLRARKIPSIKLFSFKPERL